MSDSAAAEPVAATEPAAPAAAAAAPEPDRASVVIPDKVLVKLKPIGGAPILKVKTFSVPKKKTAFYILNFLRKQLPGHDDVTICIAMSFSPSPDEPLEDLYRCFAVLRQGKPYLEVGYSLQPAFG